jgi:hypothetical protein
MLTMPYANRSTSEARVISGSNRSGTTWLLDVLAQANSLRTIFEPLHPDATPSSRPYSNRYLHPGQPCPELEQFLLRILAGEMESGWSNFRIRPDRLDPFGSPKRFLGNLRTLALHYLRYRRDRWRPTITKFVRANLLLGWIATNLPVRPLLLVRHPAAVVASKLRADPGAWHDPRELLKAYFSDESLVTDHLSHCGTLSHEKMSDIEVHTALWCVENLVPIHQAESCGIEIAHYERLLMNDEREWQRVLEQLNLSRRPGAELLARPSQQASESMKRSQFTESHVGRWMDAYTASEREQIDGILAMFGISMYRSSDPLPFDQTDRALTR